MVGREAKGDAVLRVPLTRDFRFIHEPLPVGDTSIPVLGNEDLVAALHERLMYSHGGTFLVAGFRGVGKTTLVMRALALAASRPGSSAGKGSKDGKDSKGGKDSKDGERVTLLAVHLSIARRMEPDQLLFAIVRRIFEALDDEGLFGQLPPDVQESLLLAYTRTSLSFTQTQSDASERGATLGVAPQGPLASAAPTLGLTGRRTRTRTTEAAFLAYSETDVEHDLIRIVQLLGGRRTRPTRPTRPTRTRLFRSRPPLRVHPVIVLDEVDKLTDNDEEAIADLERLLGSLKNVLTTRGAHFILVAGPDLHDRALTDADRGNGLYESVFAWRMYVPCLWTAPKRLVRELSERGRAELGPTPESSPHPLPAPPTAVDVDLDRGPGAAPDLTIDLNARELNAPESETPQLATLIAHLNFKSRGVPRRLLQEFNSLVTWDDTGLPWLHIGERDWQRVAFYDHLNALLSETISSDTTNPLSPVPINEDRWRLGAYHVADWALRSRGRVFATQDVTAAGQLDPLLKVDGPTAERLLRHLVRGGVLEVVSEPGRADATLYGNAADAAITYYRLTDTYSRKIAGLALHNEDERADLGLPSPEPPSGWSASTTLHLHARPNGEAVVVPQQSARPTDPQPSLPPVTRLNDRYEVQRMIGAGGMGAVYRGRDLRTGEAVAIKLLHAWLADDEAAVLRFRRECEIGPRVRHPNVVRSFEAIESPEPALVMELIEGQSLSQLLERGHLSLADVAGVARGIGEALDYLHSMGISRIDLKPSNIIAHPNRGPVIIDLGLAHFQDPYDRRTQTGDVVGTVFYMAPEQIRSALAADIRSDLYSLGTVLHECVTGQRLRTGSNALDVAFSIFHDPVYVTDLPVSPAMREVIGTCLAHDPADRYQVPGDFLRALASTPEAQEEPAWQRRGR
ncbi:serine/threonine-protein kinase [Streptomyces atriruber]|uniref:non-specific serine/threonine protein kinase n=1 Tax=Streptomyces atriruber TaxID=545121 RepID=A0ABV3BJD9_9ACTN